MEMTNIKEVGITVEATSGAVLYKCEIAAMILALERLVPVTLIHSGQKYVLDPEKAMNAQGR